MLERTIDSFYTFHYPDFGTPDCHPDHTAHSGQIVIVVAHEGRVEDDETSRGERMYRVRADDSWEGYAWAGELHPVHHPNPSTSSQVILQERKYKAIRPIFHTVESALEIVVALARSVAETDVQREACNVVEDHAVNVISDNDKPR